MAVKTLDALAKRDLTHEALARMQPQDQLAAIFDEADQIPEGLQRVEYHPSFTIPLGKGISGIYRGSRNEKSEDRTTGEVGEWISYRVEMRPGFEVNIRGGWGMDQFFGGGAVKIGDRVTVKRIADKAHPSNKAWRIAQYETWVG